MRSRVTPMLAAFAAFVHFTSAAPVAAQTSDRVAAEALFEQARTLMEAKRYDEACTKFEQSQRIDPAIGTLLYLADCYERSGRLASAWATFREGASVARAAGQAERAAAGEKRAELLAARLSKLVIEVAASNRDIAGFVVTRRGASVDPGVFGVEVPVDPGPHEITARAPGYQDFTATVKVGESAARERVTIPPLERSAQPAAAPEPVAAPAVVTPPVGPPPPADRGTRDGSGQRTAGLVVGGLGVVGVGVGAFFGLRAIGKNDDAKALCPRGNVCDEPRGVDLTDDAKGAALVSNIAFGVGAAAVIGGAVLYLTAPSSPAGVRLYPAVSTRAGGLSLGGRF
ncbi:MAG: tetratricopeptide repeat protein [Polyangiaceae bacterium]|nr:tetratricopeptide repeat protein [Polyangiaceae bacterium]